jgi:AcrR family transcriptional regulator
MAVSVKIQIHESLFVKDPQETKLGQDIVNQSILLIDKFGFDKFNFKKLAAKINSNEPSVYRYFTSKHQLLMYLISWYWSWVEYRIDSQAMNLKNPSDKLKISIKALLESANNDINFDHIQGEILAMIVIKESPKSYITDDISEEQKEIIFQSYFSLCRKIADVIHSINPKYKNPEALAISAIKISHEQIFFAKFLPKITRYESSASSVPEISAFVADIIFSVLKK